MFDNIEVCSTWQCVNSFSSWFSAIVSPIIAFLSLYISFKAYTYAKEKDKPKIDVDMNYCFVNVSSGDGLALALNVKNTGLRKVTINSYAWKYKLPRSLPISISTFHMQNELNSLSTSLPAKLEEGEKAVFLNKYDVLSSAGFLNNHNKFMAWLAVQRMKVQIDCTTFEYEIPLPRPQKQDLWRAYLEAKKI
ncbi:hypothetical protein L2D37_26460 [Vibrio harveyi]|uniref:hypothetical protein n=2 Tax=Vibrio TaxID=662 RepID=UPI003BB69A9C